MNTPYKRIMHWALAALGLVLLLVLVTGIYMTQRYLNAPARQAFINGHVLTMDDANRVAEAVLIEQDRIVSVGTTAEIQALMDDGTPVTDLAGKTLMPGIVDAHSHFPGAGLSEVAVDFNSPPIGKTASLQEGFARLREKAASTAEGRWVMGFGLDNTLIAEKRFPTRQELDAISTAHPIYVQHISGHLGVANSPALALLGITRESQAPEGSAIGRDAQTGELNGLITEGLALKAMAAATSFRIDEVWRMLQTAGRQYLSAGVTTAQMGLLQEPYRQRLVPLARFNLLPLRLVVWPDPVVANAILDGSVDASDSDRLHWGAFKIVLDGSIQGYTGALSRPYHQAPSPGYKGELAWNEQALRDTVMRYHKANRQMAVHVCGDAAMDAFINAYAAAQKAHPRPDARAIALHALVIRPDQLDRAKELGITPSFLATHVYYWGDRHTKTFLGPWLAPLITPEQTALKKGLRFTNHMDTPVVPMDPFLLAWITVTRQTASGAELGPGERIDALTALRSMTIDAAWQAFLEKDRGSLEAGKFADMIVLSGDPLASADALRAIKVEKTIVGGVTVYER